MARDDLEPDPPTDPAPIDDETPNRDADPGSSETGRTGPRRPGPGRPRQATTKNPRRGICRVCNRAASTPGSTYCDDHAPLKPDASPRTPDAATPASVDAIHDQLLSSLELLAMVWSVRDPQCAGVLAAHAPVIAGYWADQARSSARIAAALSSITAGGGWVQGIMVHAPLVIAIAQHHGPLARGPAEELEPGRLAEDLGADGTGELLVNGVPYAQWEAQQAAAEEEAARVAAATGLVPDGFAPEPATPMGFPRPVVPTQVEDPAAVAAREDAARLGIDQAAAAAAEAARVAAAPWSVPSSPDGLTQP